MNNKMKNLKSTSKLFITMISTIAITVIVFLLSWLYKELVVLYDSWLYEHWSPFVWDNYDFLRELLLKVRSLGWNEGIAQLWCRIGPYTPIVWPLIFTSFLALVHHVLIKKLPGYQKPERKLLTGVYLAFSALCVVFFAMPGAYTADLGRLLAVPFDFKSFEIVFSWSILVEDYFSIVIVPTVIMTWHKKSRPCVAYAFGCILWILAHFYNWQPYPEPHWLAFIILLYLIDLNIYKASGSIVFAAFFHFYMNVNVFIPDDDRTLALLPMGLALVFIYGFRYLKRSLAT
ncbi:MAG: hypothetical protein KBB32_05445 [Spirochaetia bacterium]|nr:hypothetical protein [Spirochaetia bacterium]